MKKISVAIIGWGNVGRACKTAIAGCHDLVLAGVVRRPESLCQQLSEELKNTNVVSDIKELGNVDVALLCIPSNSVIKRAQEYHKLGINTVDAFNDTTRIASVKDELDDSTKYTKTVALIGAGWEPGTNAIIRSVMQMAAITGHTTTTLGGKTGGRNMSATAIAKSIKGVKDAIVLTFATGRAQQQRKIYVVLEKEVKIDTVIKEMMTYPYMKMVPSEIFAVKNLSKYNTLNHAAEIERTGLNVNQQYSIAGVNPAFTANIMVSSARACMQAINGQQFGAYTLIERPMIDYLPGETLADKLQLVNFK